MVTTPPFRLSAESTDDACPIKATPELPKGVTLPHEPTVVSAEFRVERGVVVEVTRMTGPEFLFDSVLAALRKYKCEQSQLPISATQRYEFKSAGSETLSK